MQRKDAGINSAGTIGSNRDLVSGPHNLFLLQYLQTLSVEIDDPFWVVREQKIGLDPWLHPPCVPGFNNSLYYGTQGNEESYSNASQSRVRRSRFNLWGWVAMISRPTRASELRPLNWIFFNRPRAVSISASSLGRKVIVSSSKFDPLLSLAVVITLAPLI